MYANLSALALVTAANTTAATELPSGGDILSFLQFGVVGLLVVLFMTRKGVVPEWTLRLAEERAADERSTLLAAADAERTELLRRLADKEAQVERLQSIYENVVLPALFRATEMNMAYEEAQTERPERSERTTSRTRLRRGPDEGDDEQ